MKQLLAVFLTMKIVIGFAVCTNSALITEEIWTA
jgi:hypothetical protein